MIYCCAYLLNREAGVVLDAGVARYEGSALNGAASPFPVFRVRFYKAVDEEPGGFGVVPPLPL